MEKRCCKLAWAMSFMLMFAAFTAQVSAHDHKSPKGKVTVSDAWARATFALAKTGAIYLDITNDSKRDVKLLKVRVADTVASAAQLHETLMKDDMMQMRESEEGFLIAAGSKLSLQSGGKHVMLMGLSKPLAVGDTFTLSLIFERNVVIRVPVTVKDGR
ncbi:copper chaperone PCu(A)C [Glaciecola sp. MH2013]|uniref:copper chaperone PCu(A)C n=1 Tax=Glaciecola sp. MH2013 TaxID=2785524 RepID=UPI001E4B74C0|nr:copper chaperone PCu(A)C [Glaciecola sp. MH2013]